MTSSVTLSVDKIIWNGGGWSHGSAQIFKSSR